MILHPLATQRFSLLIPPASAHQTQTAADVGATLHIEPNDTPRAGEPNLAWFALTRRGGETIPLEACDCTLTIYSQSSQPTDEAIATPELQPVDAEGYQDIPGADVEFPQVGAYELVLQGRPTTAAAFQPFEFRFEVTVAVGTSSTENLDGMVSEPAASGSAELGASDAAASAPSASAPSAMPQAPAIAVAVALLALVSLIAVGWKWRQSAASKQPD